MGSMNLPGCSYYLEETIIGGLEKAQFMLQRDNLFTVTEDTLISNCQSQFQCRYGPTLIPVLVGIRPVMEQCVLTTESRVQSAQTPIRRQ
jgi:hypothetical protein